MAKIDRLLNRGITFVKHRRDEDARRILRAVIREDPNHQLAWGWYVQSFRDEEERIKAFEEYLHVFPKDQTAINLQVGLLKSQNERWEKLAADSNHKLNGVKQESTQQLQKTKHALNRTKLLFAIFSLIFIGVFCVTSLVSSRTVNRLSDQLDTLNRKHDDLEFNHLVLQGQYTTLQTSYTALETEHNSLIVQHNTLREDFYDLSNEYNVLLGEHNQLTNAYNALLGEYNWLETIAVTPPYILTNGRQVTVAFQKIDGSIIYWEVPFENLEYDLQRGNLARSIIVDNPWNYALYLTNSNTDEDFFVIDIRPFVDASYFSQVMADLYYQSDSDDAFIREVWNIVAQLTTYSSEIEDTPRYPMETLLAGGGDCEDTAILFASMLAAAPVNWSLEFVYMDIYNPTYPLEMNHVAVHVKMADRSYMVETTSKQEMTPYYEGVSGWFYEIGR